MKSLNDLYRPLTPITLSIVIFMPQFGSAEKVMSLRLMREVKEELENQQ